MANDQEVDLVFDDDAALEFDGEELFVDFDQIEEYDAVAQGVYPATISEASVVAIKTGANAGKPRVNVKFTITGDEENGRNVFNGYNILPSSLWAIKGLVSDCGLEPGRVGIHELASQLIGCDVAISVAQSSSRGKPRAEVASTFSIEALDESGGDASSLFS